MNGLSFDSKQECVFRYATYTILDIVDTDGGVGLRINNCINVQPRILHVNPKKTAFE